MSKERQERFESLKSLIKDNKIECLKKYDFEYLSGAVNVYNYEGLMHIAAKINNLDAFTFLHETGLSLGICDKDDYRAIHSAAFRGHKRILEYILKNDLSMINVTSSTNYTPLHCAAEDKRIKTMIFLIKQGANLHAESDYYGTPFDILKDEYYHDLAYDENMTQETAINILEGLFAAENSPEKPQETVEAADPSEAQYVAIHVQQQRGDTSSEISVSDASDTQTYGVTEELSSVKTNTAKYDVPSNIELQSGMSNPDDREDFAIDILSSDHPISRSLEEIEGAYHQLLGDATSSAH